MKHRNLQFLTEVKNRFNKLSSFNYDYDKHLLNEAETKLESFRFKEAYPDNIAYPVKPGVTFTSVVDITKDKLTNEFREFIEKLEAAVKTNPNIGQINVAGGASNVDPTLDPPKGYDKNIVELSYKNPNTNKVELSNKIIALNRGRAAKAVIEALIPQLKGKVSDPTVEISEKMAKIDVPAGIIFMPQKFKDYIPPKGVSQSYPKQGDKNFQIATCNGKLTASGFAGDKNNGYLADVIKFKPDGKTGEITFNGQSYAIPDRFVINKVKDGKKTKIIDSQYITQINTNESDFTSMKKELSEYSPNNELKGGNGNFSHKFNVENGFEYYIEIYAPFGGTVWDAQIGCGGNVQNKGGENTQQTQQGNLAIDKYKKFYINTKTKKVTETNCGDDCQLYMDGEIKDGQLLNGKKYIYDKNGLLDKIEVYKNGKYSGEGKINL